MERASMNEFWSITRISIWVILVFLVSFQANFIISWSLNDEGIALLRFRERVVNDPFGALSSWKEDNGEIDPCAWFGIECANGHVISLSLKNLCLEGTLTPELRLLSHIKSIILRNNSFAGHIPEEIKDLKDLELLDLSQNNFSKPLPPELGYIRIFLLDNNGLSCRASFNLEELKMLSELHLNNYYLTGAVEVLPYNRRNDWTKDVVHRRMLAQRLEARFLSQPENNPIGKDQDARPIRTPASPYRQQFPHHHLRPPLLPPLIKPLSSPPSLPHEQNNPPHELSPPSPASTSSAISPPPSFNPSPSSHSAATKKTTSKLPVALGATGGSIFLVLVILGIYLWRSNKITTVGPWRTGLSGQLQKAFVTGIQNLKRSELETACEDFSNVIGTSPIGTIYKGTLSNGVEIAVISLAVTSGKDWSRNLETQFRRKIETLSKLNHKNFVNLIGYCEESEHFTRMMVFEYAPNGSLFEHLHVKEAEHLDWEMRLRVAMGLAYCLEYMHQLAPPITHPNLNSSAVNLSEDYATKLSDFCFWNEVASAAQAQPIGMDNLSTSSATPESNVYSFGLILLEMMTGQIPLCLGSNSLENWVLDYLRRDQHLEQLVDPMLRHFNAEQSEKIVEVLRKCLNVDPQQRPTMSDVATRFKEITGIDRAKASPRLSPLWWAELEIQSIHGD